MLLSLLDNLDGNSNEVHQRQAEPQAFPQESYSVAFNPEHITEEKREWIDRQALDDKLTSWPEHLFEHFFIVGLPPDIEVTQIAEDLCEKERLQRDDKLDSPEEEQKYDTPPSPAYEASVIYRFPPAAPAPLDDREIAQLCFPHEVTPTKLRRSPSWSSLNEIIYGKQHTKDDQSFVFMLKVGSNMPLLGMCCYVQSMVHRPPALARDRYPNCRAPYRQCMIAAPRCYCLLSHYPFFPLHFQLLNMLLSMERLHRTIDFNSELAEQHESSALLVPNIRQHTTQHALVPHDQPVLDTVESTQKQQPQFYCPECAGIIADMCPTASSGASSPPPLRAQHQHQHQQHLQHQHQHQQHPQHPQHQHQRQHQPVHPQQLLNLAPLVVDGPRSPAAVNTNTVPGHHVGHTSPGSHSGLPAEVSSPSAATAQVQCHVCGKMFALNEAGEELGTAAAADGHKGHKLGATLQQLKQFPRKVMQATENGVAAVAHATLDSVTAVAAATHGDSAPLKHLAHKMLPHSHKPDPATNSAAIFREAPVSIIQRMMENAQLPPADSPGNEHSPAFKRRSRASRSFKVEAAILHHPRRPQQPPQQQQQQQPLLPSHSSTAITSPARLHTSVSQPLTAGVAQEAIAAAVGGARQASMQAAGPAVAASTSTSCAPHHSTCSSMPAASCTHAAPNSYSHSSAVYSMAQEHPFQELVDPENPHSAGHATPGAARLMPVWSTPTPAPGTPPATTAAPAFRTRISSNPSPSETAQPLYQDAQTLMHGNYRVPPPAGVQPAADFPETSANTNQSDTAGDGDPALPHPSSHTTHTASNSAPVGGIATTGATTYQCSGAHTPDMASGVAKHAPDATTLTTLSTFRDRPSALPPLLPGGSSPRQTTNTAVAAFSCPRCTSNASFHTAADDMETSTLGQLEELDPLSPESASSSEPPQCFDDPGDDDLRNHDLRNLPAVGQQPAGGLSDSAEDDAFMTPRDALDKPSCSQPGSDNSLPLASGASSHSERQPDGWCSKTDAGLGYNSLQHVVPVAGPANAPAADAAAAASSLLATTQGQRHPAKLQPSHSYPQSAALSQDAWNAMQMPVRLAAPQLPGPVGVAAAAGKGSDGHDAGTSSQATTCSVSSASAPAAEQATLAAGTASNIHKLPTAAAAAAAAAAPALQAAAQMPSLHLSAAAESAVSQAATDDADVPQQQQWRQQQQQQRQRSDISFIGSDTPPFSLTSVLETAYSHNVIHPGEYLHLKFDGISSLQYIRTQLPRKYTIIGAARQVMSYAEAELADALQAWPVAALARSLSMENILTMLTAALLEQQIVVFCPNIAVCSACVLALVSLLRPFMWQCLLMPVTPTAMLGFLEAPVPFVLGVQYKTQDVSARCADLIRVNVYKDQVKNASLPALPNLKRLAAALTPHYLRMRSNLSAASHRPIYVLTQEEEAGSAGFQQELLAYLSGLVGDLRPHVITNVGLKRRTGALMKDSLLDATPIKDRPFVKAFLETQMFSVYSDAIINAYVEST